MRSFVLWLTYILIFTIPWENAISISGFGTFTRGIGFILILAWMISIVFTGKIRKPSIFHLGFFLFVLLYVISAIWTYDLTGTEQRITTFVQLFAFSMILWDLFSTPAILRNGMQAYIFGAFITIGSTVSNFISGKMISIYEEGRFAGANLNANDLALILILGLPLAWHLATSHDLRRGSILNTINYAYIPLAIFAIILTASRMSIFAIVPAFLYIFITMQKLKLGIRAIFFIGLLSLTLVMQNYIPQASLERLATTSSSIATLDLGNRVMMWDRAVTVFLAHPLIGVGGGALRSFIGGAAHNTFLSILGDLGVIGIFLFFLILGIVLNKALRQPKEYSSLWLAILLIWIIGVSALTWEFYKPTWLFMSLIVISSSLFSRKKISQIYIPSHVNNSHLEIRIISKG